VRKNTHIVSTAANDATAAVACLTACIADNDWMKASRLRLKAFNTQVMWLGTSQQLAKITVRDVPLLSTVVIVVDTVRDLGVIIDSQLCMDAHVATLCRGGYISCGNYIRSLSLSTEDAETLVMYLCPVDWITVMHYCMVYRRLQSVQNTAVRLVSGFTAP